MLKEIKILFILLLLSTLIYAQDTGYLSGSAAVNLVMPLSIESGAGDLDFGEILVTSSTSKETIKPRNGKEFIVKGEAKRNVSVVFNNVELTNLAWLSGRNGTPGYLTFIPDVILGNNKKVKSGDNVLLNQVGLSGETRIFVGGSITVKKNQPVGDYEGLFVISVAY